MTTALALILAAPLIALAILWGWSHTVIGRRPQTVPEASVRVLLHLARWLAALAEALITGAIAYRDWVAERPIESRLEAHRIAYEAAHPRLEAPEEEPVTAVARRPYFWRHEDAN